MGHPERSAIGGTVLNEPEGETEAKAPAIDPVEDPAGRRCRVCGEPLSRWQQRTHPGACRREWRRRLQRIRRGKA